MLVVLLDPAASASWAIVVVSWPLAAFAGGAGMWWTLPVHWIVRLLAAAATSLAMLVVPFVFFASCPLAVFLVGDDDTVSF